MRIVKWVVLPIVVAVLAGYAVHTAVESFILDRAKRDVRDVLLSHRGVHLYIQRTMHPEFYRARASASIQKDYYAPEILSSSFTVRVLHGYYNEERKKAGLPPVYYKLAALNPRNPVNAADPAEERLLRYFRDHPEEKEYHAVEKIGGTPYLVFAMPFLRNAAPCLRCHGRPEDAPEGLRARYPDDAGYGEKLGDLRAVESLRVPIAGERFATWAATLAVFAGLGTICALFVFNGFLGRAVRNRTAELSASEERWKFALEGAGDGIWDWNVVTDAAFFSERSRAIFRSDGGVERTFGEWEKRVHPDDAAARRGALERHLRGETEVYESEHRLRGDDGEYRWILARGKVMERSPAGAPLRVMGTHRDVTAQRQAQDELRESEEKFRAIFDGMTDGDLAVDPETRRCVEGNRAACEMLGYEREELLALRVDDLHPPEELPRVLEAFGRLARGEQATSPELVMRRKDGSTFFAEVRSGPMALRGRPVLNAVIRDVSERRAAALEREKLEAQLAQAQKLETVGRLAGGVAHDFNNMLSVIMGQADLAQLRLDPADPLHAQLSEILKAAGRSADLTRQLLGFARKQTINPRVLDLNEAVTGTLSMLRRLIGEDVELAWGPGADAGKVRIDPSQLDQVLANLAVNARDAIEGPGTLTLETSRVVLGRTKWPGQPDFVPGPYAVLSVTDNGRGMSKDVQEHIFEPFFTTKGPGKGTGLGLATVFGIVRQNGGHLTVYSELGKGTTLRLYFPCCHEEASAPFPDEAESVVGGAETILLAEDDDAIRRVAQRILEGAGYTVVSAASPAEAIAAAGVHDGDIHLLLTDVVMPDMNGRELAQRIGEVRPRTQFLYMSGYTANVIAHRGVLDEGIHFISKPLGRSQLLRAVRAVLDGESTPEAPAS